jgi:hypothetical protein
MHARRGDETEASQSNSRNTYRKLSRPEFKARCDAMVDGMIQEFYVRHALARKLLDPEFFSHEFFVRSTIESVLRIDLMRRINPMVCSAVAASDPVLCKQWGLYAADEGLHGRLFAQDLHTLGVADDTIYNTRPLFATELLSGYLLHTLQTEGAMGVVASAYYVETVSERTQPRWLENIERHTGPQATRGSRAHLKIDEKQGHVDLAWNMCMRLVETSADEERFVEHVQKLHGLLSAYVVEVLNLTIGGKDPQEAALLGAVETVAAGAGHG